jgi:phosphoglycolate phosphatase
MHCPTCRRNATRTWHCVIAITILSRDQDLLLFEGAEAMIDELATMGYMLAVATGKTRAGLNRAFDVSGLGTRFHASRCADECRSKPHPQMLEELMAEFGVACPRRR